jgi:hypothetical protein
MTAEQVRIAQTTALQPFNPPTEIEAVPTPEEMQNWYPDPAPEKMRWRTEVNVTTGERKHIELTLEEYRARHVAKIVSRNEYVARQAEEARKAKRAALLEKLLDEAEAKERT